MSINPLPDESSNELSRMIKRLMRRQGVAVNAVPSLEGWNNFVGSIWNLGRSVG